MLLPAIDRQRNMSRTQWRLRWYGGHSKNTDRPHLRLLFDLARINNKQHSLKDCRLYVQLLRGLPPDWW